MKKTWFFILSFFLLINVSSALAQSSQDEINDSSVQFEEWAKTLSEFVKDVRFDEQDVQNLLSQWDDFNSFGEEQDTEEEEYMDFDSILMTQRTVPGQNPGALTVKHGLKKQCGLWLWLCGPKLRKASLKASLT